MMQIEEEIEIVRSQPRLNDVLRLLARVTLLLLAMAMVLWVVLSVIRFVRTVFRIVNFIAEVIADPVGFASKLTPKLVELWRSRRQSATAEE
jgi:hypothetical protein